jgi:transcriptional regulator with XRE-family HTH domain
VAVRKSERELLGLRVKELRRARGLSQEQLAEKMEITPNYLSSIERGRENPTLDLLTILARGLKIELVSLFNYAWQQMSDAELRQLIRSLSDNADSERLREMFMLIKAREL